MLGGQVSLHRAADRIYLAAAIWQGNARYGKVWHTTMAHKLAAQECLEPCIFSQTPVPYRPSAEYPLFWAGLWLLEHIEIDN